MSQELSQIVAELRLIRQALERMAPAPERPLSSVEVEFWRFVDADRSRQAALRSSCSSAQQSIESKFNGWSADRRFSLSDEQR